MRANSTDSAYSQAFCVTHCELRKMSDGIKLTEREVEVLSWVAQGKTNWAIAKILGLSQATVRKHLQNIYSKLDVENRTAAVVSLLQASRLSAESRLSDDFRANGSG